MRAGGGFNHRDSLATRCSSRTTTSRRSVSTKAVERARSRWPARIIEVECDTLEQVVEACAAGADLVMLDNMTPEQVREGGRRSSAARAKIEVSRRASRSTPSAPTPKTGVDFISVGAITHSVRVLDIGLDIDVTRQLTMLLDDRRRQHADRRRAVPTAHELLDTLAHRDRSPTAPPTSSR